MNINVFIWFLLKFRVDAIYDRVVSAIQLEKTNQSKQEHTVGFSGNSTATNGSVSSTGDLKPCSGHTFSSCSSLSAASSTSSLLTSLKSDIDALSSASESALQIKIGELLGVPVQDSTAMNLIEILNNRMDLIFAAESSQTSISVDQPVVEHGERKDMEPMDGNSNKMRKLGDLSDATSVKCNQFDCQSNATESKYFINPHDPKQIVCKFCPKSFVLHKDIANHVRKMHGDEFPYQCKKCDSGFLYEAQRNLHEWKCKAKKFQCYLCRETSRHKFNLVYHMRSKHTGEKPFDCPRCPERFYIRWNVVRHMKVHHKTH